jgi:L-ascorbate metabolism protein UlaG (beta-lactamase superfamily)
VRIKWLGHACFLIETADGTRIVTDPFNEEVGYPLPAVEAEIVTVSHQHFDHNAVAVVRGRPHVVQEPGEHRLGTITIKGVSTFHDAEQGAKRGANVVFVIEADGLRICHLGDLGHLLNEEQLRRIGRVDVLLVPVGGTFTIDAGQAAETVAALRPRIAVPMHYKTDYINFPITGLEDFSRLFERVSTCDTLEVTAARLPAATEIVVVSFAGTGAAS